MGDDDQRRRPQPSPHRNADPAALPDRAHPRSIRATDPRAPRQDPPRSPAPHSAPRLSSTSTRKAVRQSRAKARCSSSIGSRRPQWRRLASTPSSPSRGGSFGTGAGAARMHDPIERRTRPERRRSASTRGRHVRRVAWASPARRVIYRCRFFRSVWPAVERRTGRHPHKVGSMEAGSSSSDELRRGVGCAMCQGGPLGSH